MSARETLQVAQILKTIRDNRWPIACILESRDARASAPRSTPREPISHMRRVLES
jgi:hypothetical protein